MQLSFTWQTVVPVDDTILAMATCVAPDRAGVLRVRVVPYAARDPQGHRGEIDVVALDRDGVALREAQIRFVQSDPGVLRRVAELLGLRLARELGWLDGLDAEDEE